jgi:chromosome segregation ATPase
MEPGAIEAELRSINARITASHDAIGMLRERTARHDTAIKVLSTELREMRTDIEGMNLRLDRLGRNFYVAAAAMGGLMLSIVGLIVTLFATG